MAHRWFMHDAHLGRAFLFLDILDEYTLLSMIVMVIPCIWYVVGMKLVMSYVNFELPQAPFARAPVGECQLFAALHSVSFGRVFMRTVSGFVSKKMPI